MDRLYIVDTETNEYLCFAKGLLNGWFSGNVDLLEDFINPRSGDSFIIGTEDNDDFYANWIENGTNFNKEGGWVIYNK